MARIRWYGPTLLLLATLTLAMLVGPGLVRQIARQYESARIEQVRQGLADNPTLSSLSESFKDVATVVRPSVTSISLLARSRDPLRGGGRLMHYSNGSGWVYRHYNDFDADPSDYEDFIITNHHVVEDVLLGRAEQIVVRFEDGGEYRATIVGTDAQTDVAVLKIRRDGLIPAALAAEPAQQGEIAFAVGSPFQFEFSMSQGIVSATGRRLRDAGVNSYENYIQTDAAINPGNSGGPLTNVRGEVIGMNTAIAVNGRPETTFSGLGFAIPIDLIVNVVDQIIETGEVRRGYMGVIITELDYATAQELGFDGKGVLAQPVPGQPAAQAGIELGDIITHVDGEAVSTGEELRIAIASHPPGSDVPIRVWRNGESSIVRLTLTEYPQQPERLSMSDGLGNPFEPAEESLANDLGLGRFETLTPALASRIGRPYTPGVLVRLIEHGSPADRRGVRPMTIITAVDGEPVLDLAAFNAAIDRADPRGVTLTIKQWDASGDGLYSEQQVELATR